MGDDQSPEENENNACATHCSAGTGQSAVLKLQEVVITGFKSFSASTKVGPFQGLTCVIGPNGAGKSVVGEAIAFALGGNRQMMRAQNLAMLRNNNNQSQKALETSVILKLALAENGRQQTLQIKRSLTTRESEYLVQHDEGGWQKVTQGDLRLCLAARGLDTSVIDRYIVTQNRKAVLVEDPCKLMSYFEQLIGSSGLAMRIEALTQQIEQAGSDISSLEAEIGSLEEQRAKLAPHVQKWRLFNADSKRFNKNKLRFLEDQAEDVKAKIRTLTPKVAQLERERDEAEKRHDDVASELDSAAQKEKEAASVATRLQHVQTKLQQQVEKLHLQQAKLTVQLECAAKARKQAKSKYEQQVKCCRAREGDLAARRVDLDAVEIQLQDLASRISENDVKLKSFRQKLGPEAKKITSVVELQATVARLEDALAELDTAASRPGGQCAALKSMLENSQHELAACQADIAELHATEAVQREKVRSCRDAVPGIAKAIADNKEQVSVATEKAIHLQAVLREARLISALPEAKQSALGAAVRELAQLDAVGGFSGRFFGRLATLARCKDAAALKAVNAVLANQYNLDRSLVVSDRETAQQVIQYLEVNRVGTATCIIVSECKPSTERQRQETAGVGATRLMAYIEVLPHATAASVAFESRLWAWDVVPYAGVALRYIKGQPGGKGGQRRNLVTLQGELFKTDGEIFAAHTPSSAGRYGLKGPGEPVGEAHTQAPAEVAPKPDLASLEAEYQSLAQDLEGATLKLRALEAEEQCNKKNLSSARAAVDRCLAEVKSKETMFNRLTASRQEVEKQLITMQKGLEAERCSKAKELAACKEQCEEAKKALHSNAALGFVDAEAEAVRLTRDSSKLLSLKTQLNGEIKKLSSSIAAWKGDIQKMKAQMEEADMASNPASMDALKEELDKASAKLAKASQAHCKASEHMVRKKDELDKLKRAVKASKAILEEACTALQQATDNLADQERILSRMQEAIASLHATETEDDPECSQRSKRRCHGVQAPSQSGGGRAGTRSSRRSKGSASQPTSDATSSGQSGHGRMTAQQLLAEEKRLQAVRESIDSNSLQEDLKIAIGLNTAAVKLKDLNCHLDRLTAEKESLEEERYNTVIAAVAKVNSQLDPIYNQLTNGQGSSYCSCCNDKMFMFSEGLVLHTRPESTHWRPLRLLSGGQQALACLALSFALQAAYPSPFYFFDEVDSALDTANASRVATYIRSQKHAQYILVSHKPQVYERADTVVGIYTKKDGTSGAVTLLCQQPDADDHEEGGHDNKGPSHVPMQLHPFAIRT